MDHSSNVGLALAVADADDVVVGQLALIANVDVGAARSQLITRLKSEPDVVVPCRVRSQC